LSDQPKDVIVNSFKGQIEKAEKDTGWLSFNNINYKKIKVDAYRAVIKRDPLFFGPPGGIGVIVLHFDADNGLTKINAEIKPVKWGVWLPAGFLITFTGVVIWLVHGIDKFLIIVLAWLIVVTPVYLTIVLYRYRLKKYLELVLKDVGVGGTLMSVKQTSYSQNFRI